MTVMRKSRLSTPRDYLALIARRKWVILFTFLGLLGLTLLVAELIPNTYVSESLMLFRPREVSTNLVKDIASGTSDERITAIEETILSRSNLLKIANEFQGVLPQYRDLSDEKKVEKMRSQLQIEFISEKIRDEVTPITHVRIQFHGQNPDVTQHITSRLASLFIEYENQSREKQIYGTTTFLSSEMNRMQRELEISNNQLKEAKERYGNELPAQLEADLNTLERLQRQRTDDEEAVDRQANLQRTLESQISQTPPNLPAASPAAATVARAADPLVDVYLRKSQEYNDLRARATDKYPDVQRLRAEMESLRKRIPKEDLEPAAPSNPTPAESEREPNPVYQNLVAQLSSVKTEIEIRKRDKAQVEEQIARLNAKVQAAPSAEFEIASMERANADLVRRADDLRTRLQEAKLSETIEDTRKGAQFVILDPANHPGDPVSPNRVLLRLYGVIFSLCVALLVGTALDLSQRRVFTSAELERLIYAPVMVEIPRMTGGVDLHKVRLAKLRYAAIFIASSGIYVWALHFLYEHHSALLTFLDPFVEKLQG